MKYTVAKSKNSFKLKVMKDLAKSVLLDQRPKAVKEQTNTQMPEQNVPEA